MGMQIANVSHIPRRSKCAVFYACLRQPSGQSEEARQAGNLRQEAQQGENRASRYCYRGHIFSIVLARHCRIGKCHAGRGKLGNEDGQANFVVKPSLPSMRKNFSFCHPTAFLK